VDELHAAWMLHSRPYKERSVIAEFLVENHGRVAMVVRGVRQAKSRTAAMIQPFTRVLLSWSGRSELKTLKTMEPSSAMHLSGRSLYCGFYLNELLIRSVLPGQNLDGLFDLYEMVLEKLSEDVSIEPLLRLFEIELLELTGYAPSLQYDGASGDSIQPEGLYQFIQGQGFLPVYRPRDKDRSMYFPGQLLLALADRDFSQPVLYPGFKRYTRLALTPLVGGKPLKSRELFRTREKSDP
jgi:DNA repair protein RecO (recombination protein O)